MIDVTFSVKYNEDINLSLNLLIYTILYVIDFKSPTNTQNNSTRIDVEKLKLMLELKQMRIAKKVH